MQSQESSIIGISILVIILLGLITVVLFFVFVNRKNKLVQENFETKLANQKRQHQLELQALRSRMNPHFVHNSLNAIQYYIQKNDVETSENYLTKFSKLMRMFFEYSKRPNITLVEELKLLKNYLAIEKLRFEENVDYKFNVDENLDTENQTIPTMMLQPLVENAINHGLFHKKDNGLVTLSFSTINDKTYKIQITDNGVGINATKQMKPKGIKRVSSSEVLEERLKLINQNDSYNITFKIKDLSEFSKTTGTQITLTITQK